MKQFEYQTLVIKKDASREEMLDQLNRLGQEGWEAISIESFAKVGKANIIFQMASTSGFLILLKRELS